MPSTEACLAGSHPQGQSTVCVCGGPGLQTPSQMPPRGASGGSSHTSGRPLSLSPWPRQPGAWGVPASGAEPVCRTDLGKGWGGGALGAVGPRYTGCGRKRRHVPSEVRVRL